MEPARCSLSSDQLNTRGNWTPVSHGQVSGGGWVDGASFDVVSAMYNGKMNNQNMCVLETSQISLKVL